MTNTKDPETSAIALKGDLSRLKIGDGHRARGNIGRRLGIFAASIIVLLMLGGLVAAFKSHRPVVEVASARSIDSSGTSVLLNASGYVTPRRRATVAAKITGQIKEIYAEEGLRVKAGQVLAILDCAQQVAVLASTKSDRDATAAALTDLEVQLSHAERELQRAEDLRAAGVNSQEALEIARTARDSMRSKIVLTKEQTRAAEARISVADQDVMNCTVRSPFDGIVVSKDAQRGEIVSPLSAGGAFTRTGIATLVDMESIEIEVDVNESYINRVRPRQKVIATMDAYPDWQIPATVRTIIPSADRQKATVKVRIALDKLDPRILPDMGAKVAFLSDERHSTGSRPEARALIPKSSVQVADGKALVFVVREGKLERRVVTLGGEHGGDVEVAAGVDAGDTVVVNGAETLRDGQEVEIRR